jgi:serine/threonine protein phosphatase PrpC
MKGSEKGSKPTVESTVAPAKQASQSLSETKSRTTGDATINNNSIVAKCSGVSKIGVNKGPMNQDCFFQHVELDDNCSRHLFGVADGHGTLGHLVSDFLKRRIPANVISHLTHGTNPTTAMAKAFSKTSEELAVTGVDIEYAGSTLCSVLLVSKTLYCANVGDSRAVLAKRVGSALKPIPLSEDHKPELPAERSRIMASGGTVHPYRLRGGITVGPDRVWLGNLDIPGLAMSRAFGDIVATRAGVNAIPDIKEVELTKQDEFIIIGSDGLWEFVTNADAVRIASSYVANNDARGAATELVKEAQNRWKRREEMVDDTTAVVIILNIA